MKKTFWLVLASLMIIFSGFHSVKAGIDIFAPKIESVSPAIAFNDGPIHLTITGSRFNQSAMVKLTRDGFPDIMATDLQITNNTIDCTCDLSDQSDGTWNVSVTNGSIFGKKPKSDILFSALTIEYPAPIITSIFPKDIYFKKASLIEARIWGAHFREGIKVDMVGPDGQTINGVHIKIMEDTQINCNFNVTRQPIGFYKIIVTNDDGKSAVLKNSFQIKEFSPELPVIKPNVRHKVNSVEPQAPSPANPTPEPSPIPDTKQTPRITNNSPDAEKISVSPTADLNLKFKPLFFDVNQFNIRDADLPSLENDLTLLKGNPNFIIAICGYADEQRTPLNNLKLSQKRAETIRDFLIANDITGKIIIFSFGKDNAGGAGLAEAQKQNNRRVDVSLWENQPTKEQVALVKSH